MAWINFPMSSSLHQGQMSRIIKDAMCTTLCGNEVLYPYIKS